MATQSQADRWPKVFKLATNRAILDVSAALQSEPRKIVWTLVNYEQQPTVSVRHFMDPDVLKALAEEILRGTFETSFPKGFVEYKGTPKGKDGRPEARVFRIAYKPERNYPFAIRIERGVGEVVGQGAVKMVEKQEEGSILATAFDMKRLMVTVRDHILREELVERLWAQREASRATAQQRQAG